MEWSEILGLGVWAALATAATNIFSTWWFGKGQRRQVAVYHATRIWVELERYAYSCADLISEESTYYASNGSRGDLIIDLPPLVVAVDTDWKALDVEFVDRVLSFQSEIVRAQGEVTGERHHLTPDDTATEPAAQAGLLGYRAYRLAADLRARYQKGSRLDQLHPWDYIAVLKEKHDAKVAEYDQYRPAGQ